MDKDIDFNYLQAYEGVCRDEFVPGYGFIESDDFKNQLLSSGNGIHTEAFATMIFDQCFTRTFNVEFAFNPNFKDFRKKFKYGVNSDRPMIFVYSPALYMSRYLPEFKEAFRSYTEVFDIYYTADESEASQLFYTKEFPEIFPYVAIIDPKKRKELKMIKGAIE